MATLTSSGLPEGVCEPSAGNKLRPGIEPCGTQQVTQGAGSRRAYCTQCTVRVKLADDSFVSKMEKKKETVFEAVEVGSEDLKRTKIATVQTLSERGWKMGSISVVYELLCKADSPSQPTPRLRVGESVMRASSCVHRG